VKSVQSTISHAARTLKQRFLRPARLRLRHALARTYRPLLGRTCFIGITGSCGKTTTTELIAAILAEDSRVRRSSHLNTSDQIAQTLLASWPADRFCVSEISGHSLKGLTSSIELLRPSIGVVTNIGYDHYRSHRTLQTAAAVKSRLVESLPASGTAILNADDPNVIPMRERTKARVITYGLSPDAMLRGQNVSSAWPARLSLDISFGVDTVHVQTQLLGEHWASAVLAAVAASVVAGVTLPQAAARVETFKPVPYRMCPHQTPDGITFISDNWKAPLWTLPGSLDFVRKASAPRKIVIIGSISDTPRSFSDRYKIALKQSIHIADMTIFAGEHAFSALRSSLYDRNKVMAFTSLPPLSTFLSGYLQPGDLVLLKGVEEVDHLQRLILTRTGEVTCWQTCRKRRFCDDCRHLYAAQKEPAFILPQQETSEHASHS
jgi:UDP-N-acetylmuramoyl-tripeptide--D-alanyl-D-alanine ligase